MLKCDKCNYVARKSEDLRFHKGLDHFNPNAPAPQRETPKPRPEKKFFGLF